MTEHNIKFIAADMDGTLLNEHGQLDERFFELYRELQDNNIMFAAASGRQYFSLAQTFASIKDNMMFIAENGTLVMHQDKELYSCTLDITSIHNIITAARLIDGAHIVLCGKKSAYIETTSEQAIEEIGHYYHRCEQVSDLLAVDDEFIKVAICHFDGSEEHVFPTINAQFGHGYQVVVSAKVWLDVMNANASKGHAIQHLQQTMNFTKQQSMAFGDYLNDIEMLQQCAHSYAMENAHQNVKDIAQFTAPSNKESGVLQVIEQYLLSLK